MPTNPAVPQPTPVALAALDLDAKVRELESLANAVIELRGRRDVDRRAIENAEIELEVAATPEAILALLAAARRGAGDTAIAIATHEAIAPLYFADNSDYEAGLYNVVKVLNPALWMRCEDGVTSAIYAETLAAADAARAAHPEEPQHG